MKRGAKKGQTALKKIVAKVKKIHKRGGSWKAAIKKASAQYRKGSI